MIKVLLCAVAAIAVSGCATDAAQASREETTILVSPTGSNLLRKPAATRADGVTSYDREALEDGRRNAVPTAPAGGGPR